MIWKNQRCGQNW